MIVINSRPIKSKSRLVVLTTKIIPTVANKIRAIYSALYFVEFKKFLDIRIVRKGIMENISVWSGNLLKKMRYIIINNNEIKEMGITNLFFLEKIKSKQIIPIPRIGIRIVGNKWINSPVVIGYFISTLILSSIILINGAGYIPIKTIKIINGVRIIISFFVRSFIFTPLNLFFKGPINVL